MYFFFFQAEDGIRDLTVTGVQTCALPISMCAGIAALRQLAKPGLYEEMTQLGKHLASGWRAELAEAGIPAQVNAIGSLATIFFTPGPVKNYADAKRSDTKRYARFFREMLARGIFLAPSQFEAAFLSAAHTSADIDRTLAVARGGLRGMTTAPDH